MKALHQWGVGLLASLLLASTPAAAQQLGTAIGGTTPSFTAVTAGSGSSGATSYGFTGALNCGLYYAGGSVGRLACGGTDIIQFSNSIVTLFGGVGAASGQLVASGGTTILFPADGSATLYNNAKTGWTALQFGGTTSSFPELKRNGTALNVRLADDSADAPLTASTGTFSGALNAQAGLQVNGSLLCSQTAPTIANGGGLGTVGTIVGSACAFDVTAGTGAASTFTITLPTAAHEWTCTGSDITTASTSVFILKQFGTGTATTAVMGVYSDVGVLAAVGTSDHLRIMCMGF